MADTDDSSDEIAQHIISVLIVEDNKDIGAFLVEAIQLETPYRPMLAENADRALETIKTLVPDLFILDYQLPHMDGLKLYDHLHAIKAFGHVPALIMSANLPIEEIQKRGLSSIYKPFELVEMLELIEKLLVQ